MLLNYFKNLITPKIITYEYALSAAEVKDALYKVFKTKNEQHLEFDINGGFISETEFEYNLEYNTTLRGIKAFPMYGVVMPKNDKTTYITLTSQTKFTGNFLLIIIGLIALISLILFFTNGDIKFLFLFLAMLFLAPRILRLYIDSLNSALLIRYNKYLHNAILEAYRTKHYGQ